MNYCSHGYLMVTCPRCNGRTPDPRPAPVVAEGQLTIDLNEVVRRAADRVGNTTSRQETYRPPVVDDPALD